MDYFILTPTFEVVSASKRQWLSFTATARFQKITMINNHRISTVFTGTGMTLFETIIFYENGDQDEFAQYETYEDALTGHNDACQKVHSENIIN